MASLWEIWTIQSDKGNSSNQCNKFAKVTNQGWAVCLWMPIRLFVKIMITCQPKYIHF